ncbi:uncharacterized protein N7483_007405 [Penicillium malachiteum]|uniref:uncharacterized protein n=1 Tax=Penicillium malachiteum TaxID=1324776 RepID=UPI00254923D6|nr:uncharacterized protein N7483_007405 [Penicillium malachiteum]KAJ5726048.1 hypothetical protein N7483_007405 [Penicillium malachiteum]
MAKQVVTQFPVRRSTNIPGGYIENHQTTPKDEEKIKFVQRINSFLHETDADQYELECRQRIEESFKSTTSNVQALNEALEAFRLKLCKPGQSQVSQPVPSDQKVHWSDLMKELRNAQNYYKTRHGGGPIGKALSKFGRYTESLKGWLDVLPSGDYGSTICGGIKLLLTAVDETYKLDSLVFVALSDIPEILYEARFYLDACRASRLSMNMLEKMADLCNHILIVLREIVYYCLETKSKHLVSAVFKGPKSKESLRQSISELRECATSLSRAAELTNHQTIQNISEDIQGIKQNCHNSEGSRTDIYVNLYVLYSGHPSLDSKGELLSDDIDGSSQFQNWTNKSKRKNASLLVQGHFDSEGGTSALTHLCARIAYESAPNSKVLVLTHFCSLNTASRAEIGRRAGARGLIASFIGQLLSYDSHRVHFDLSQISGHKLSRIEEFSLKRLCWLFEMLIAQVKTGTTIICIIDNISSYETNEALDDMEWLVSCLQTWVIQANQTSKPRMKLLITDTNQTTRIYRYFQGGDILNLSERGGASGDDWDDESEEDTWII